MSTFSLSFAGACRGETRAYFKVRSQGDLIQNARAKALTAEGRSLPAELLFSNAPNSKRAYIVSVPLFSTEKITIIVEINARGGNDLSPIFCKTISNKRLAFLSRSNSVLRPGLCNELRESEHRLRSNTGSKLKIIQAFPSTDNATTYRCHILSNTPYDLDRFALRDGTGDPIDALPRFIENWHTPISSSAYPFEAVISFTIGDNHRYFALQTPDGAFAASNEHYRESLMVRQNALMINPGIDDRYRNVVSFPSFENANHYAIKRRDPNGLFRDEAESGCDPKRYAPLFSVVVPLYETPAEYLKDMLDSVMAQTYPDWQLVLVNASPQNKTMREILEMYVDERITLLELDENLGIAGNTNFGISAAEGKYVAFLDHDDALAPRALESYANAIENDPSIDILYCDEDNFVNRAAPCSYPRFKPGHNLSLLYSHFYYLHCLAISRKALVEAGCADLDSSGAQDYDLALHVLEITQNIAHIPEVLYHWRAHPGSTNGGVMESKPYAEAAAIRSICRHLTRRGVDATVDDVDIPGVYNVNYRKLGKKEEISLIVVPGKTRELIGFVTSCGLEKPDRTPITEIIVVGSRPIGILDPLPTGLKSSVKQVEADPDTSFAAAVNMGIAAASGNLALICSPTLEGDLLDTAAQLGGCLKREEVGVVAPKLYYSDGLVQHAGLCVKLDGTIGYLNQNFPANMGGGYHGTAECSCDYSALSPDCFMMRREQFLQLGGLEDFDGCPEISLADFCFKLREKGLSATVLPDAPLVNNDALALWPDRRTAFSSPNSISLKLLWEKWPDSYRIDVLANPHVDLSTSYFRLLTD